MLAKAFLHNIAKLATLPNFHVIWLNVLRRIAVDLNPQQSSSEQLYETSLQMLTNILMIMDADGHFQSKPGDGTQDIRELTWAVLDAICPQIRTHLSACAPNVLQPQHSETVSAHLTETISDDTTKPDTPTSGNADTLNAAIVTSSPSIHPSQESTASDVANQLSFAV